jgi:hypothetical protein
MMGLDNLVDISQERITVDATVLGRLLAAAERNITDAHVTEISAENQFNAAYKAIMQLAMWHCWPPYDHDTAAQPDYRCG